MLLKTIVSSHFHILRTHNFSKCNLYATTISGHGYDAISQYNKTPINIGHAFHTFPTQNHQIPTNFSQQLHTSSTHHHQTPTNIGQRLVDKVPPSLKPYFLLARVHQPVGFYLLFLPSLCGIGLATSPGDLPHLGVVAICVTGSFLMRAAGCVINDMWDKDFDRHVERTKLRPLACNQVTPFQAVVYLGGLLGGAASTLLFLNWHCAVIAVSSLGLVATYPFFKRVTYWPQVVLGPTFNWGVLVGYAAIANSFNISQCLPLFLSTCILTFAYDTIYAHQDKKDDIRIGVKSTALLFGDRTKPYLGVCAGLFGSGLLATSLLSPDLGPIFYLGAAFSTAHLCKQIYSVDLDNQESLHRTFRSNTVLLSILSGSIIIDKFLQGMAF